MNQQFINKLTDIIAYAALPITLPLHLWKYRNWKKKRENEVNKYKTERNH